MGRESLEREGAIERLSRFGRNVNALGALAIGGAALAIPGPNVLLAAWAGINAAQAGGFEWARRAAEKKRKKKRK
jgi:hypothetical protein